MNTPHPISRYELVFRLRFTGYRTVQTSSKEHSKISQNVSSCAVRNSVKSLHCAPNLKALEVGIVLEKQDLKDKRKLQLRK